MTGFDWKYCIYGAENVQITVTIENSYRMDKLQSMVQLHCSSSAVNANPFYGTEWKALNCVFMFLWEFRQVFTKWPSHSL